MEIKRKIEVKNRDVIGSISVFHRLSFNSHCITDNARYMRQIKDTGKSCDDDQSWKF